MRKTVNQETKIFIAPMMDWTTRHCRYFHRLLTPHARLYTEMVTTGAILYGDQPRHLDFDPAEHPLALQLGGSDPHDLAICAQIGADWGYDEINLNCGCPSDRVQQGRFGACLMNEPETVATAIAAMIKAAPKTEITIKCRIGVDNSDDEKFLNDFVRINREAGCQTFIIHARKAWLKGLSPKENREIPPLRYDIAGDLKNRYPDLKIILNGGLKTVTAVQDALRIFDGVMIGRAAYETPYFLAELEHALYGTPLPDRHVVVEMMKNYLTICRTQTPDFPINAVTRHMLGLYQAVPGARGWRRTLTVGAQAPDASPDLLTTALKNFKSTSANN